MKPDTRSFYEAAVVRALVHILGALDQALELSSLARLAALSPLHFHRVFRGMVGETPVELHRRLRLERAAARLLASDDAVVSIAFDAGYETHEAFTRAFHRAYGLSPSAFRQPPADCARPRQAQLAAPSGIHFGDSSQSMSSFAVPLFTGEDLMDVTLVTMPELRVAAAPHLGPYARIAEAFARLGALAGPAGLLAFPDAWMVAIYYDDPESTPAEQLRSDAGLTVPEGVTLPSGLEERRLLAGRYARTVHAGPYTLLGDTWARFMGQWLPRSGQRVGEGSSYEVYRNNPGNAAPADLRTELYLPLA